MRTRRPRAPAVAVAAGGSLTHPAAAASPPAAAALAAVAAGGSLTHPAAAASPATPTKVLTIVEENHTYQQMHDQMPYLFSVAQTYGYATDWTALSHPSLPNYLGMVAGSTFGITDDKNPSAHQLTAKTVFDQAFNKGKTAKAYSESMPSNCNQTNSGQYAVRHNPWTYFTASRARCNSYDVPFSAFTPANLPNAGMVTPNLCNDAHDCSLGVADDWLQANLPAVLASADFTSGRLTVVVTADEQGGGGNGPVLTVVANARLSGKVVTTPLNHYSLCRYYAQVLGAPSLLKAASAPDMKAAFGL